MMVPKGGREGAGSKREREEGRNRKAQGKKENENWERTLGKKMVCEGVKFF